LVPFRRTIRGFGGLEGSIRDACPPVSKFFRRNPLLGSLPPSNLLQLENRETGRKAQGKGDHYDK